MTTPAFEAILAKLYTDRAMREAFYADPDAVARGAGLNDHERAALAAIDRVGLELAAASLARKRAKSRPIV